MVHPRGWPRIRGCANSSKRNSRALPRTWLQYETIKRFALLDRDFTFDGGELTYTLKLKRRVIEQRYAGVIEKLYAEPFVARS